MKLHGRLCASESLSQRADTLSAVQEAVEGVMAGVGANPDVATVFLTPHHAARVEEVLERVRGVLGADVVVGTTASGTIGGGEEHQAGRGLAIWAARLPGARVQAFHLSLEDSGEGGGVVRGWPDAGPAAGAVLLADPFSFPLDPFLSSLRQTKRAPQIVGGVASGADRADGNRLICDDEIHETGAVGFVMDGAVRLQPVLTQGCRPIGRRFEVTRCERNVIYELSGESAAESLDAVVRGLEEEERNRFRQGPQLGVMVSDDKNELGGGFLVRGLMGVDPVAGSIVVNDLVREGATVQFHARDGETASQEMDSMLGIASGIIPDAAGALLFSCNGRGHRLFGESHHDVEHLRRFYPDLPVSGFFAAGEIGPICGQPYLHGFTASVGLFVRNSEAD